MGRLSLTKVFYGFKSSLSIYQATTLTTFSSSCVVACSSCSPVRPHLLQLPTYALSPITCSHRAMRSASQRENGKSRSLSNNQQRQKFSKFCQWHNSTVRLTFTLQKDDQMWTYIYIYIYYVIVHKVQKAEQWMFTQSNNHRDIHKKI